MSSSPLHGPIPLGLHFPKLHGPPLNAPAQEVHSKIFTDLFSVLSDTLSSSPQVSDLAISELASSVREETSTWMGRHVPAAQQNNC